MMTGYVNAQGEQVLKVAHPSFNQDWSPMRGGGAPFRWNSVWWASPMYFDAEGKINPYVFESWSSSDDKKVWTFKIAGNAVFSDGSKITAADVKGSWELAAMPNTKNQRVSQVLSGVVGYAEVNGGSAKELSGCRHQGRCHCRSDAWRLRSDLLHAPRQPHRADRQGLAGARR